MEKLFETERLTVFVVTIITELNPMPRYQFLAYHRQIDRPMLVANLLVPTKDSYGFRSVCWLEVASEYRRQGIGKELLEGVEQYLGVELDASPGSADGEQFLKAVGRLEEGA